MMLFTPYTHLKAKPDLTAFQFAGIGIGEIILRQIRFIPTPTANTVEMQLTDLRGGSEKPALIVDQKDMHHIQATLIQVIELYTEKYPQKVVRLCGATKETSQLFQTAIARHMEKLLPFFDVRSERNWVVPLKKQGSPIAFLIKRKERVFFSFHTISTTLCSRSQLFEQAVHVELSRHFEIGYVSSENSN